MDSIFDKNICYFVPYHKDYHSIHTINYVLETKQRPFSSLKFASVYSMYYVNSGKGRLHTVGKVQELSEGDVFFTFPAEQFCIEAVENFTYIYISFLGSRANMIMEKLKISPRNCVFEGCGEIGEFWKTGLETPEELTDLISESVLLCTFTYLGKKNIVFESKGRENGNAALTIKKYIDDNFSDPSISLDTISRELSYNSKYVSSVFKKQMGVGVVEYINTIRIQHSCTLIRQGYVSVSDIASCCGYSDPQYFSKVFKQKMGASPGIYIRDAKNA